MRIAEINDIASVASALADGLRARGHTVDVIRPRLFGGSLPWMVKPVVGPVRAVEWAQLIHQVNTGNFDAAHIHYAYLGMVGVLGKFPFILHCHGTDVRGVTPFTRPMIERSLEAAEHVYYATPDLAEYVRERRPDAEFLPNPVEDDLFYPTCPPSSINSVFICCSLTDIKGAPRLLAACERLARVRPDIRITAIAGGDYTDAFARLPNVTLIPRQPRAALPAILNRHGLVLGQALLGSIGMAELESMACGRPVIAWYRFNGAYEERPPLIRAVDGVDIAMAVERLVDQPEERDRLGAQARAWVQRFHNVEDAALRVEAVARAVAANR
jgi:glycosyltransferase involved in cell wall biosynthesis